MSSTVYLGKDKKKFCKHFVAFPRKFDKKVFVFGFSKCSGNCQKKDIWTCPGHLQRTNSIKLLLSLVLNFSFFSTKIILHAIFPFFYVILSAHGCGFIVLSSFTFLFFQRKLINIFNLWRQQQFTSEGENKYGKDYFSIEVQKNSQTWSWK